jgi:hypothetical protein
MVAAYSTYGERKGAYRCLVGRSERKKPLGRPGNIWIDII